MINVGLYSDTHCNYDLATDDMYKFEIPTTYAVFTTSDVDEKDFVNSIQGTWKYTFL
jgi:AraC family transcriptional regulator